MASRKITKNDTTASNDAERVALLAERCAELLLALPMGRSRDPDHNDGPWRNWYEEYPDQLVVDLGTFINGYFRTQTMSRQPDASPRRRKDFNDMHKAAVKFAANIRRCGVRNLVNQVDLDDPDPPDFEGLFAKLESATMWMEKNSSKDLWPSRRWLKCSARRFVEGVIFVVEWYTGETIKRDTKGTPAAELKVLKEIVATVDPTIGEGTITEAIKNTSRSGRNMSGRRPWPRKGATVDWSALHPEESHGGEIKS
jgi:hypothetical protein